jgi:hypothetical protein
VSRRKPLPLDDPRWVPLTRAHAERAKQRGSDEFADEDFNRELNEGARGIRSMRRLEHPGWGESSEPELLFQEFWRDHYVCSWSGRVDVVPRLDPRYGIAELQRFIFYIWGPDYEKIFGAAAAEPRTQVASTTKASEGETKQGRTLKHHWIEITAEVAYREASATKKERGMSDLALAKRVRRWCATQLQQRPALSEIREIVKTVRRRFRQPE